jgi:actin-related protein
MLATTKLLSSLYFNFNQVFDNRPLFHYATHTFNAGKDVDQNLESLLAECYLIDFEDKIVPFKKEIINLDHLIQDIKCRACICRKFKNDYKDNPDIELNNSDIELSSSDYQSEIKNSGAKDVFYRINSNLTLKIPENVRQDAAEILFQSREYASIPEALLECILKCPLDIKKEISKNILLVGGTCMV